MILASNSPRRKQILEETGFCLEIIPSDVVEESDKGNLVEKIKDISYKKAFSIARDNKNKFVLAADTIVELDGKVFGKPKNKKDIYDFLMKLSGKVHRVITAYSFINIDKKIYMNEISENKVEFYPMTKEEIEWYIETEEPFDKAGAYGIQGKGRVFVKRIDGDFYSIMGFPVSHFLKTVEKLGYKLQDINKI